MAPRGVHKPSLITSSEETLLIRWQPPADDGGCEVSGYRLYRDDGLGGDVASPVDFAAPGDPTETLSEAFVFEHLLTLGATFTGKTIRVSLEALNSEGATLCDGYLSALVAREPWAPTSAPVRVSSSRNSLMVDLPLVLADGGAALQAYSLEMDNGAAGGFHVVGNRSVASLERSYSLSGLTQGLVYRFRYRVRNSLGWSAYSPSASLLVAGVPGRPDRPVVDGTSATAFSLRFSEVVDNGGSPVLSYVLYLRDETSQDYRLATTYDGASMAHVLDIVDDALAAGAVHYFKYQALNGVGASEPSEEASAALAPLPAAPSLAPWLDYSASSLESLLVRWAPGDSVPQSPAAIAVSGYRLYVDGGNDGSYQLVHDGALLPGVLEYRLSAATGVVDVGRAYRLKVSALNYNGEGPASQEALLFMCLPPRDLVAPEYVSSTETTLTVRWSPPRASGGCPVSQYRVRRDTGAGDDISVQEGGDLEPHSTSLTMTLGAPAPSTIFRIQVEAFNAVGSVLSGLGSFVLADLPDAPDPPVNDASGTSESQIKVRFAETLPNNRGSLIFGVQLAMDDGEGGSFVTVVGEDDTAPTLQTAYVATSTVKGRAYRFRCRVRNSIGWSTWSSPDSLIVAAVSPGRPGAPRLGSATSTTITLLLSIPEDSGGSPLSLFELFINDGDDANEADTLVPTYSQSLLQHSLTVASDGLTSGLIYKFRFRATNAVGSSEFSDTVRFALADAPAAPGAPLFLVAQTSER